MYPKKIFLDMDLYTILMLLGVIASMVLVRVLSDRRRMRAKWQNLVLFNAVISVMVGYGSAVLFQAFYNFMEDGKFEIVNTTGATFYGGLIGGAVCFLLIYFIAGHFIFPDGYHKAHLRTVTDLAVPCITAAHGLGRLGCLMAGCCYGAETNAWYGVPQYDFSTGVYVDRIPVQLFEAVFLLALCALTFILFWKGKKYLMPLYMLTYGIWRFIAEQLRVDDRGETVVDFLSPSQLISVLLLAGAVALFLVEYFMDKRKAQQPQEDKPGESDS